MVQPPAKPAVNLIQAGEIICVRVHSANHDKFLICICPIGLKFIAINSDPWPFDADAQITITKADFGFLDRQSYISVSRPIRLMAMDLNVLNTAPHRRIGSCSAEMRQKIKNAADRSITLTGIDQGLIKKNL